MKIAVQLWSVREPAKDDLARTLASVGELGFDGIEFYGGYSTPPDRLKTWCERAGLEVAGYHVAYDDLFERPLEENVGYHRELGNTRLICPFVPEQQRTTGAAWRALALRFNELAAALLPHGMFTGFHNHRVEFERVGGELPWELFFDATSSDVIMELDIGNAAPTGEDPVGQLERYPGRARSIHIKDWSREGPVLIGDGSVPIERVVELCERQGKTEWYIIEQEIAGMPQLECVGRCLEKFKALVR
jgi:sugar phosphate isomerase/epimerase